MIKSTVGLLAVLGMISCGNPPSSMSTQGSSSPVSLRSPVSSPSVARSTTPSPVANLAACKPSQHSASFARLTTSPPPAGSTSGARGAISGGVPGDGEVIEPRLIYAVNTAGAQFGAYSTETIFDQERYTITGVAPGKYYVYSTFRPVQCLPGGDVAGTFYSAAARCDFGDGCDGHTPIAVTVGSGATSAGINPVDSWDNLPIPAPPRSVVPSDPPRETARKSYTSARAAATGFAKQIHSAIFVDRLAVCPANRACISVGTEHDGTRAAYFVGAGGSSGNWSTCAIYVYQDKAGWHGLTYTFCGTPKFASVGQSMAVWVGLGDSTSCVNVRGTPAGVKVGCVRAGTTVKIDGGPVYAPLKGSDGLWWHLAGRGWIADDYLVWGHM